MIRNGYSRRLAAEAERTRLTEQWQAYPTPVRQVLTTLLHHHGLQAAHEATEAVEQYAKWQHGLLNSEQVLEKKEERDDATPPA